MEVAVNDGIGLKIKGCARGAKLIERKEPRGWI